MKKTLKHIVIAVTVFTSFITSHTMVGQTPHSDPAWQLIFEDEFDNMLVDTAKWRSSYPWNQKSYLGDSIRTQMGYRTRNFENCSLDTTGAGTLKVISRKESYTGECWDNWYRTVSIVVYDTVRLDTIAIDTLNFTSSFMATVTLDTILLHDLIHDSIWVTIIIPETNMGNRVQIISDTIGAPHPEVTSHNFNYTTGMLFGLQKFRYGYYEIKCHLPVPYGLYSGEGLGANFWLAGGGDSIALYSELDVFEFSGKENKHTSNVHYKLDGISDLWLHRDSATIMLDSIIDFTDYHVFAAEWAEGQISINIDGQPRRIAHPPGELTAMQMIIDINHPLHTMSQFIDTAYTILPYEYKIDYVKIWQLKQDCDSAVSLCSFDAQSFDYAVYKSIHLGGSGCTPTIGNGNNVTLRATDGITLDSGFTVELGAEFMALPTSCPEQLEIINSASGNTAYPPPAYFDKHNNN